MERSPGRQTRVGGSDTDFPKGRLCLILFAVAALYERRTWILNGSRRS